MTDDSGDEDFGPIRVDSAVVATYQWDAWSAALDRTVRRARRVAWTAAAGVALGAAVVGVTMLPGPGKLSVVLYAPLLAWATWTGVLRAVTASGVRGPLRELGGVVVPALVPQIDRDGVVSLLARGGTLVANASTTIVADRGDSQVVLVAKEYDMSTVPPLMFPSAGGGP